MRTTVTIDPDVEALLARAMKDKGLSFKEALNGALRAGLLAGSAGRKPAPVSIPVFDLKRRPGINLDKALTLAGDIEDEEQMRKLALKK
ncbi:MAG: hypothetical protein A2138_25545 [Deltaproteobacteria bacterium RBG_16_71_12]|nr:MAG: hypothetical protein A2138_25545 [Deltaproteobacteria bacterium RBG_16_71_12]